MLASYYSLAGHEPACQPTCCITLGESPNLLNHGCKMEMTTLAHCVLRTKGCSARMCLSDSNERVPFGI